MKNFETVYHDYVYDVCTHCNLSQTNATYLRYIDLGDTYAYAYNCQHCYQIYTVKIKKEDLLKLGREIHHGYNHFVIPGYEDSLHHYKKYTEYTEN